MRIKFFLPVFFLCLMTVSMSAKKVTSGFSVTCSYLPARYPLWDYDVAEWKSKTVNGFGAGLEYSLSVPLSQSNWVFGTGVGCTYSRIDESGNQKLTVGRFLVPGQPGYLIESKLPVPFSFNAYRETQREYSYLYIPLTLGYRLYSKGNLGIMPYLGLRGKYNISYTEKDHVESATWLDHYFELFNESSVTSEAKRFIMQYEAGVKVEHKNLFLSLGFVRDGKRMFRTAFNEREYRSFWGPYSFNCWQLGMGINF